jgi:hypothetical protein
MQFDALGAYRGKASDIHRPSLLLPLNKRGRFFLKIKEGNQMISKKERKIKSRSQLGQFEQQGGIE